MGLNTTLIIAHTSTIEEYIVTSVGDVDYGVYGRYGDNHGYYYRGDKTVVLNALDEVYKATFSQVIAEFAMVRDFSMPSNGSSNYNLSEQGSPLPDKFFIFDKDGNTPVLSTRYSEPMDAYNPDELVELPCFQNTLFKDEIISTIEKSKKRFGCENIIVLAYHS